MMQISRLKARFAAKKAGARQGQASLRPLGSDDSHRP